MVNEANNGHNESRQETLRVHHLQIRFLEQQKSHTSSLELEESTFELQFDEILLL